MNPETPPPPLPPTPPPQVPLATPERPGLVSAFLILLLPCAAMIVLGLLCRTVPSIRGSPLFALPLFASLFAGPLVAGIVSGRRIARHVGMQVVAQVVMTFGLIAVSFFACLPGCALSL